MSSKASHMMGVDLTYECLNNCTIRVHLRAYRDCTGASSIGNNVVFTPQTPMCIAPTAITPWSTQVTTEVTPVCPGWPTQCTTPGAQINGVQEFYWYRDYDICSAGNCIFTLSWTDCCRNGTINSGAANQSLYISSTTLNTSLPICNSSPYFANPPVPYICAGQTYTFNQGAIDPDGDSLSYSLGPCYQGSGGLQVTYSAGYTPTAPLGSTWGTTIDPQTGDITMTPNPGNTLTAVLCVYVTEWRNGVVLDTIVRDIQITVLNCPSNNLPTTPGIVNLSGGMQNSATEITVCVGTPFSFNIQGLDINPGQTVKMYWNRNILGGQFYEMGNPAVQDTVLGTNPTCTFTWTPTSTGLFTFLLTIKDNACPIIGRNQYTIKINVIAGLAGATANWNPVGCTNVQLTANPGPNGTAPFSYVWSGNGNLSTNPNATNSTLTHGYPSPATYQYSVTITDNYGCTATITDSLQVTTGPTANAGPDISMCTGFSTTLGAPTIPGQTYSWSPGTGIAPTNTAQPTVSLSNPGPGIITQTYTLTVSDAFCQATDFVTITVYPTPSPAIAGNLNICNGNTTTLTATGGTHFLWSNGDTTQNTTVNPPVTTTYTVTVSNNGCASVPASATVNVSPGPAAIVTGPALVCPGSPATLTVVGGTSWQWSTGATTQTILLPNIQGSTTVSVNAAIGTCAGPPSSFTVDVLPVPVADFVNQIACEGSVTQFHDQTLDPTGLATGWIWDFGDPSSGPSNFGALQNPQHIYSNAGTYNATLVVTSSNGCKDTLTKQVMINPLPVPNFSFQNVCEDQAITFTDQTPGTVTAWSWLFGNGATANTSTATYTFNNPNPYNVTLWVTDNNGCANKVTRTVFVYPKPQPHFAVENHCFDRITNFIDQTVLNDPFGTLVSSWAWNFGDPASGANNASTLQYPVHNYQPGNYQVTLTTTSSMGCTETITLPVSTESAGRVIPGADTVCVGYPASLTAINPYPEYNLVWYYGQNDTTPFHIGSTLNTPPVEGTVSYWVTVRDNDGCEIERELIRAFNYNYYNSGISATQLDLEIPNAITEFNPLNYNQIAPHIVSWLWDFGDGHSSSDANPVHQYLKPGEYNVSLTLLDENGCNYLWEWENYITVEELIEMWIPNAFSPNGDNKNERFEIQSRLITDIQISIFDRWGKLIFESQDLNFKWDGKDRTGTEMPEGVYMFVVRAHTYDGRSYDKSGSVTLLR